MSSIESKEEFVWVRTRYPLDSTGRTNRAGVEMRVRSSNWDEVVANLALIVEGADAVELRGNFDDRVVGMLKGVREVSLVGQRLCFGVSDEGVAALAACKVLALFGCPNVSDKGIAKLSHLVSLSLFDCAAVVGLGFESLRSLSRLRLAYCPAITDAGLKSLAGRDVDVVVDSCGQLSNDGLAHLSWCSSVSLTNLNGWKVTGACFKHLSRVISLSFVNCPGLKGWDLDELAGCNRLSVKGCGFTHESSREFLAVSACDFEYVE